MNASPAARLCGAHLMALGPDPDPRALADVVWLGMQLALAGAVVETESGGADGPGKARDAQETKPAGAPPGDVIPPVSEHVSTQPAPDALVPMYPAYFMHPFGKIGASRMHIPAGEPLPQRLRLERALKPFKRRLPSRQQRDLDPAATAEASAEWRVITPVYRAAPERWFDVAILAGDSDVMHVWDATLLELRRMLARHGAFRQVRLWRYAMRNDALVLFTASAAGAAPRILVDLQGRRLCWFVTTGTSPLWRHAAVAEFVATLGRHGPTALVQLMPSRAWPHTLLGDASEEALALAPGLATTRLWLREPFSGAFQRARDALTVPATSLEPERLAAWASFAMASRRVPHPAIRLQTGAQSAMRPPALAAQAVSPRQRIAAFRAYASPQSFQLLRLLAGMPLSLPVMRLMQMGMADRAQVHLAEIMLSGLIERVTPSDSAVPVDLVEYDFIPGIRADLLDSLTLGEGNLIDASVTQLVEQARLFVEAYAGTAKASFPVLVPDAMGTERLLEQAKSFLSVTRQFGALPRYEAGPVSATDATEPTGESRTVVTAVPSSLPPRAAVVFLPESSIKEQVHGSAMFMHGASPLRCLLFFETDQQHSWLVASDHTVAMVLDNGVNRVKGSMVQRTSCWLDALPVSATRTVKGEAVVRFGAAETRGWYYSSALFHSAQALQDAVIAMVPGGKNGTLMQLSALALQYDETRASTNPGTTRTAAMHAIVDHIAGVPALAEPDLTLATRSATAGIRLAAVVSLQRRFDPAHMAWIFDCVEGDQAFLAFQAALALRQALPALTSEERVRMRNLAIESKRKLSVAGKHDVNIHHLLDQFEILTRTPDALVDAGKTSRILIGSTMPSLAGYWWQAFNLLRELGYDILDPRATGLSPGNPPRLADIAQCDLFLQLVSIGARYQRLDLDSIRMAELEYREAKMLDKPVLTFIFPEPSSSDSAERGSANVAADDVPALIGNSAAIVVGSPEAFEKALRSELRTFDRVAADLALAAARHLGRVQTRHQEILPGVSVSVNEGNGLASEADVLALAGNLVACANLLHERVTSKFLAPLVNRLTKERRQLVSALEDAQAELRQRLRQIVRHPSACTVHGLGISQERLLSVIAVIAERIAAATDMRDLYELLTYLVDIAGEVLSADGPSFARLLMLIEVEIGKMTQKLHAAGPELP